ncbi:MAG: polysaccharide biosynthesis/export family protein [Opitutaceae bacterium]|nr:polysaccharide biosynthesis/export family protein [Opitutaceae bacterium]
MRTILIILTSAFFVTCSSSNPAPPPSGADLPPGSDVVVSTYQIGVGDVISVNVWGNPDLTLSVPVRPDGYISVPLIGDVAASDTDAESLAERITGLLSDQVRNPQVTVIISQVNSTEYVTRVRITGAVVSPQSMKYARGMSVLDAILEAGGPSDLASANRAKLYRTVEGRLIELDVRFNDILLRGNLETIYPIRPGDVITVPERLF